MALIVLSAGADGRKDDQDRNYQPAICLSASDCSDLLLPFQFGTDWNDQCRKMRRAVCANGLKQDFVIADERHSTQNFLVRFNPFGFPRQDFPLHSQIRQRRIFITDDPRLLPIFLSAYLKLAYRTKPTGGALRQTVLSLKISSYVPPECWRQRRAGIMESAPAYS